MKIKCPLCDFENKERSKFCSNCNILLTKQDYSEDNLYIKKKGKENYKVIEPRIEITASKSTRGSLPATPPVMYYLGKNKKIKGQIGYFNLQEWWLNDLTKEEKDIILSIYHPLSSDDDSLIKGKIFSTSQTAIGLLSGLSGWFKKPEYHKIGYRIIKKAEELASDTIPILDLHFLYQSKIEIYYRNRDIDELALSKTIEACKQQIGISEKVKKAYIKKNGLPLPMHVGYTQLCIIMEKKKKFEGVIRLATIAKEQGWSGNWDKRIEKSKKKMEDLSKTNLSNI